MLLSIHPENPQQKFIEQVNDLLNKGGTMIYPTDTVYGLGCSLNQSSAIVKICRLRKLDPKKAHLTIVCKDLRQLSALAFQLNKSTFKALKRNLPGPFTVILKSAKVLPKQLRNRKQTLGFRIIDHPIVSALLEAHDHPLITISFKDENDQLEYPSDPYEIHEEYGKNVDIVIDGGIGSLMPSTIVSYESGALEILREGHQEFIEA